MTELEQYIQIYFEVPAPSVKSLSSLFEETKIKKGSYFVKEGGYNSRLGFIKNGYLRVYKSNDSKEITQWVSSQGEFIADLANILFDVPSKWNIQALTDCELYTISNENYKQLNDHVRGWDQLEKLFLGKCFLTLEDRVFSFISATAQERYQQLFKIKPDLFNHVPLQFIASMLGMTPETLSRIRNKKIS